MDRFTEINLDSWPRAGEYRLFTEQWTTISYTVTMRINVTKTVKALKDRKLKFVPALLWLVTRELHQQENFLLAVRDGVLGKWDGIHPMYPTVNDTGNLTFHTTRYTASFRQFCIDYQNESAENAGKTGIFASPMPENTYIISIVPYMNFESVSFHLKNAKNYYAPVFDIGRYTETDGELQLPVSVTVNHAAADLSHVHRLFNGLQEALNHPDTWYAT